MVNWILILHEDSFEKTAYLSRMVRLGQCKKTEYSCGSWIPIGFMCFSLASIVNSSIMKLSFFGHYNPPMKWFDIWASLTGTFPSSTCLPLCFSYQPKFLCLYYDYTIIAPWFQWYLELYLHWSSRSTIFYLKQISAPVVRDFSCGDCSKKCSK